MNSKKYFITASIIFLFLLSACSDNNDNNPSVEPSEPLKILSIGGSRVEGNHPTYESYRYELWKNLISHNWNVDFVGYLEDEASYPEHMGLTFDPDHAGVAGFMTTNVLDIIQDILNEEADVILMDIYMPEMDGTQATQVILERYPEAKIIATTACVVKTEKTKITFIISFS